MVLAHMQETGLLQEYFFGATDLARSLLGTLLIRGYLFLSFRFFSRSLAAAQVFIFVFNSALNSGQLEILLAAFDLIRISALSAASALPEAVFLRGL